MRKISAVVLMLILLFVCGSGVGDVTESKSHFQIGHNALFKGRYEDAITEFSKAIELNNGFVDAYFMRGVVYHTLGKYEQAIGEFEKTLNLEPRHTYAKYFRVNAFSKQQHRKLVHQFSIPYEKGEVVAENDMSKILQKITHVLGEARKYRSQLRFKDLQCAELKDLQCAELKDDQFTIIEWSFDFISPDSFNVTQGTRLENYPHGARDEWISIGASNFITIFTASVKSERKSHSIQIERFIRVDKYREILKKLDIKRVSIERITNGEFYLVEMSLPKNIMLGDWPITQFRQQLARSLYHVIGNFKYGESYSFVFYEVPTVSDDVTPHSIGVNPDLAIVQDDLVTVLKLWINAVDYHPVKAQIEIDGHLENGDKVSFVLEQVFSDFNNSVQILAPPL